MMAIEALLIVLCFPSKEGFMMKKSDIGCYSSDLFRKENNNSQDS